MIFIMCGGAAFSWRESSARRCDPPRHPTPPHPTPTSGGGGWGSGG